jgi:hypothetical protein
MGEWSLWDVNRLGCRGNHYMTIIAQISRVIR